MNKNYTKLTQLAILLVLLVSTLAADCANPIYSSTEFTNANVTRPRYLETPAQTTGLEQCKNFNDQESCCDASTIVDIQKLVDEAKSQLQLKSGNRLKGIRGFLMPFLKLKNLPKDQRKEIREGLKTQLKDFQKAIIEGTKNHAACLDVILQHYATMLCQGCDPNYATTNFPDNKIHISDVYATELSETCKAVVDFQSGLEENIRQAFLMAIDVLSIYIGEQTQQKPSGNAPNKPKDVPRIPKENIPGRFDGKDKSKKEQFKQSSSGKTVPIPDDLVNTDELFQNFVKSCTTVEECKTWFLTHFFDKIFLKLDTIVKPSATDVIQENDYVVETTPARLLSNLRRLAASSGLNPITYASTSTTLDTTTSIDGIDSNTNTDTYVESEFNNAITSAEQAEGSEESSIIVKTSAILMFVMAFMLFM